MADVIVTGTVGGSSYSGGALLFPLLETVGRGDQQREVTWDCRALGSTAVLLHLGLEPGMTVKLQGRLDLTVEVFVGEALVKRTVWVTGVLGVSGNSAGKATTGA